MEITSRGVNSASLSPQAAVDSDSPPSSQSGSIAASDSDGYAASPELTRLLDQVRAEPEVRGDRVQAAAQRVQQGYYNSQSGIDETAQAMIAAS